MTDRPLWWLATATYPHTLEEGQEPMKGATQYGYESWWDSNAKNLSGSVGAWKPGYPK